MQAIDPIVRQTCLRAVQEAERNFRVRILHAAMSPASGDPRETKGEEYQLRVSFVRQPRDYIVDGPAPLSTGTEILPGTNIRLFALDARDAFLHVDRSPEQFSMAALSPYIDGAVSEPLQRSTWMESLAPSFVAAAPQLRESVTRALDMMIAVARDSLRAQPAPAPTFGTPVPEGNTLAAARHRFVMDRAYAALAAKAHLASGALPAVNDLEFPAPLMQRGLSLRNLIDRPQNDHLAMDNAVREVDAYCRHVGPALGGVRANAFGRPVDAPRGQTLEEFAREVRNGVADRVDTATAAMEQLNEGNLGRAYLVDGNLREFNPAPAPAAIAAPMPPPVPMPAETMSM